MEALEISDIQKQKGELWEHVAEITFCLQTGEDVMKLTLSKNAMWEIVNFCKREMSYATELKQNK